MYDCYYSCFKLKAPPIFQNLVKELGLETVVEFKNMLKEGSYACYWNRIYLVGPFGVGKTTLSKNLVGDSIPDMWVSTDGIWIYMGIAGMDTEQRKWVFLDKGKFVILIKELLSPRQRSCEGI